MPICEDCGSNIDSRGMYNHLRGAWCLTTFNRNEQIKLGFQRFDIKTANLCREARIPINYVADSFSPGFTRRRLKYHYSYWGPPWIPAFINHVVPIDREDLVAELSVVASEPEEIKALIGIFELKKLKENEHGRT